MKQIPAKGMTSEELLPTLESFKKNDVRWREGKTWAYVYDPGEEAANVIKSAYTMYLTENGLDPTCFPSLLKLETDVVSMAASHLKGDENVVGNFTSGGTESIILAVKAAREFNRKNKPQITQPEIVLPITAHAAFHKAAYYLDVKPVLVEVDPVTFKADVAAMKAAITPNTILMVGSAISYAHGVVDPITELAKLAQDNDLLFHVDGCMGGFLLPYFRRLGADVPDFEFNVPGVTSISMDLHKYAFAAKGASVILYRDKSLRKHQMFACAQWTGYTIVNPTVQSSKTGGPIAAAWAILHFIGDEGYLDMARRMYEGIQKVSKAMERMEDVRLLGTPEMNLLCFTSDTVNVFHISDEMTERGWTVHPQLEYGSSPANLHISLNPASVHLIDAFLQDLADSVAAAKKLPSSDMAAGMKETFAALDPAEVGEEVFAQMLGMAGIQGTALPGRMAEVNEILNALPPLLKERLLTEFLNEMYTYKE